MDAAGAAELVEALFERNASLAMAESCTAGLLADALGSVPGASRVFWGSFVCYDVAAKTAMLGVDARLIAEYGAVSEETVQAMAKGALAKSGAVLSVAVTGLAGPEGDGSPVPVGTVWIATALAGAEVRASCFRYRGSRAEVRNAAVRDAISECLDRIRNYRYI